MNRILVEITESQNRHHHHNRIIVLADDDHGAHGKQAPSAASHEEYLGLKTGKSQSTGCTDLNSMNNSFEPKKGTQMKQV